MIHINYHDITHDDMNNGDGLRVVLWLSGCSHHCYNCQNPQTWNPDNGIPFDEDAKQEIFEELSKDYISGITFSGGDPLNEHNIIEVLSLIREIRDKYPILKNSDSKKVRNFVDFWHENSNEIHISSKPKTIWLYSGFTWEQIMYPMITENIDLEREKTIKVRQDILKLCDVFIDGRYIEEKRDITLKWCGSSNQRVIDVQKSLEQNKIYLYDK